MHLGLLLSIFVSGRQVLATHPEPDAKSPRASGGCHTSLSEAQLWARQQRPISKDVVVAMCPGRLKPERTVFTAADSGTGTGTFIYRGSSSAQRTVLDLGVRIRNWAADSTAGPGIWSAPIPSTVTHSRNLWVNGKRAIRARSAAPLANTTEARVTNDSYVAVFSNVTLSKGMEFVYRPACASWTQPRCLVESATTAGATTTVRMESPCFYRYQTRVRMTTTSPSIFPVWVENGLALLDAPNEWFADFNAGKLYYKPEVGQDIASSEVVLGSCAAAVSTSLENDTQSDAHCESALEVQGGGALGVRRHRLRVSNLAAAAQNWVC